MDSERKRQIEEEERYRAGLRREIDREFQREYKPNYWYGFLLNCIIVGSGFFLIAKPVAGILWIVVAIGLALLTGGILWPVTAVGVLIHYHNAYVAKYEK